MPGLSRDFSLFYFKVELFGYAGRRDLVREPGAKWEMWSEYGRVKPSGCHDHSIYKPFHHNDLLQNFSNEEDVLIFRNFLTVHRLLPCLYNSLCLYSLITLIEITSSLKYEHQILKRFISASRSSVQNSVRCTYSDLYDRLSVGRHIHQIKKLYFSSKSIHSNVCPKYFSFIRDSSSKLINQYLNQYNKLAFRVLQYLISGQYLTI